MRHLATLSLVGMLVALGVLLYVHREGDASEPPAPAPPTPVDKPAPVAAPAKPAPAPLARPLRTVALGWELIAPGVLAGDQLKGATFGNAATVDDLARALARGGGEPTGADIAIVPLASYVAAYERLRALQPEVVFVVGWSRGREALLGPDAAALAKASGAVKLAGAPGQPETFLALFVLDLAGVPAAKVELVDKDPRALTAALRTPKSRPAGKLLLTSADTPHLMPIVAIVPHGFAAAHAAELEAWGRAWLAGVAKLQKDVPAAGRQVAALPEAPQVLDLIEALGQVEFASLRENAVALGMSGRGALTLADIFRTTWRLWRDTGVLTTPPPETAPIDPSLVASLARTDPTAVADAPRPRLASEAGVRPEVLLVVRAPAGKLDAEAFVTRIGYLAGVFDRLSLRIAVKNDAKTAELFAQMARERFGLRPAQLVVATRSAAPATIEVLSN
jgi:hypothetical protein